MEKTKTGIANLIRVMEQGILTESPKARLEEREQQQACLQAETAALEAKKPVISRQMIVDFICGFRSCNPKRLDHRRRLINCFANKIVLFDDKNIFTYNSKTGELSFRLKKSSPQSPVRKLYRRQCQAIITRTSCRSEGCSSFSSVAI